MFGGGASWVSGGLNITQDTEFGWATGSEANEVSWVQLPRPLASHLQASSTGSPAASSKTSRGLRREPAQFYTGVKEVLAMFGQNGFYPSAGPAVREFLPMLLPTVAQDSRLDAPPHSDTGLAVTIP